MKRTKMGEVFAGVVTSCPMQVNAKYSCLNQLTFAFACFSR